MWRKKKKRNYYLLFFPFISFYFCYFFPSRATENYFYTYHLISLKFTPWYIFIKKIKKKKPLLNKTARIFNRFLYFSLLLNHCTEIFFPIWSLKSYVQTCSRKDFFFFFYLKWDETPWVYGKSIVGAYITRITYI